MKEEKNKCSIYGCSKPVFGTRMNTPYCREHLYELLLRNEKTKCGKCEYAKKEKEEGEEKSIWCEKYMIFTNANWNCKQVKEKYPSILEGVKPPELKKNA